MSMTGTSENYMKAEDRAFGEFGKDYGMAVLRELSKLGFTLQVAYEDD